VLLVAACCLAPPARATAPFVPAYEQKQKAATAGLMADRAEGGRLEIPLSGRLLLNLSVEGGPSLEVQLTQPVANADLWKASPAFAPQTTLLKEGRVRWQQTFRLDPLKNGDLALQLAPLKYRDDPDNPWTEVAWKPIPVKVTTQITKVDPDEARDITGIEELPPELSWRDWVFWVGLGLVVVALTLLTWQLARRWRRKTAELPPERWALRELDRVEGLGLIEAEEVARYHTLLSDVVRAYLEKRFQLPASKQTTAEFLESMRQSPHLAPEQQAVLRDFLERCDLAKFALARPAPEECRAVAAMARDLVRQTTPDAPRT
jgi:hypothetical protein